MNDFKPDIKTLGFEVNDAEFSAPAPPPYRNTGSGASVSNPVRHSPTTRKLPLHSLRQWMENVVDNVVRPQTDLPTPPDSPGLGDLQLTDVTLAPGFRHDGDTILIAEDMGFQVDSRALSAASATFETLVGKQKAFLSASQNIVLPMTQLSYKDARSLLSIVTPYAFHSRSPLSLEDLTTVADLFDTYGMRPAARFGLARVVEARSVDFDASSVTECIAWARLAHKVRSIRTLRKALGISSPSALREYWLLPDDAVAALEPHLYRALVLVGNTYTLLGEEGLTAIQFKYQDGQLCLRNADGDVVAH